MFADTAKITVIAGNGGNGAVSFRREKYINAGGPDGGDGGKGGDVVFVPDKSLSTLADFRYKRKYQASSGSNGSGKRCYGRGGEDLVVKVPFGTIVRDAESGRIIADLSEDKRVIVAHGGKGGFGNVHFATPTRQIPRFAKPGMPGETLELSLELKLIADVGLVGFPNVGKSTIISAVSAARPKIANYHFTTLVPVLGVVSPYEGCSFVMADIPGLIEGAAQGVGLGHEFLRHVERCRLIVHVVDVSGIEGRDPKEDFEKINYELSEFSETLSSSPQIVVANKCDIASEEAIADFEAFVNEKGIKLFRVCAATKSGTRELVDEIVLRLRDLPPVKRYSADPVPTNINFSGDRRAFTVTDEDGVYIVEAEWLVPILNSVNMDDYESLQYFQRVLRSSGIIDKLEEMGINEGDTVSIYDFEFDYVR